MESSSSSVISPSAFKGKESKVPPTEHATFWSRLCSRIASKSTGPTSSSTSELRTSPKPAARTSSAFPLCRSLSIFKTRPTVARPSSSSSSVSSKTLHEDRCLDPRRPPHFPTPQTSRSTLRIVMPPTAIVENPVENDQQKVVKEFFTGLSPNVTRPRNPRFQLLPATADDISELTRIQFNAFLDPFQYEPYHEVLYPGGNTAPARAAAAARILEDFNTDKKAMFLKVVDRETGKIAAGGRWTVYHENPGEVKVVADWIPEEEKDRREHAEHVLNGLYRNRQKITRGKPYVVLEMLYTDLEYQRQGAGQLVMDWGVSKAEELGYQSILESTRFGFGLYERNGYNGERTWLEVPEKWFWRTPVHYWFMHRPAKGETETIGKGLSLKEN